jgi:putative hydrolase of the HAD superfamily
MARAPRVVFDFGAVLFRWRPGHVVAQVWPDKATTPDGLQRAVVDCFQSYGGDWGLFDQGLIDAPELARRHSARLGCTEQEVLALVEAAADELQAQPEVLELLRALKAAGHRLSYLSNMPAPLAARLKARNPLDDWFESGVFSSHVQVCKPDPRIFSLAAAHYQTEPANCLLIDDHPANVQAARQAAWQAELFTDAASLAVSLRERGLLPQ